MREALASAARWLGEHVVLAALVLFVAGASAVAIIAIVRARSAPDVAAYGHTGYVAAQRALHRVEAAAQLVVLRNALASGSSAEQVVAQVDRLQADLAWLLSVSEDADLASDVEGLLDELEGRVRAQDPAAADVAEQLHMRLLRHRGAF